MLESGKINISSVPILLFINQNSHFYSIKSNKFIIIVIHNWEKIIHFFFPFIYLLFTIIIQCEQFFWNRRKITIVDNIIGTEGVFEIFRLSNIE